MSLLSLPCKRNRDQFKILQLLELVDKRLFSIVAWFALTRMICICVQLLLGSWPKDESVAMFQRGAGLFKIKVSIYLNQISITTKTCSWFPQHLFCKIRSGGSQGVLKVVWFYIFVCLCCLHKMHILADFKSCLKWEKRQNNNLTYLYWPIISSAARWGATKASPPPT